MRYRVIWSKGVARRSAPHTGTADENTWTGNVYYQLDEVDVIEDNIPDELDPTNENKKWVKFADGLFGASNYPDSIGVPRVRMEKIEEPVDPDPVEPCENETFVLKVDGFKEVSGTLECE